MMTQTTTCFTTVIRKIYQATVFAVFAVLITACAGIDDKPTEDDYLIKEETFEWGLDDNGITQLPAMELPQSSALSDESKAAQRLYKAYWNEWFQIRDKICKKSVLAASKEALPAIRACRAAAFKKTRWYKDAMARYPVDIEEKTIGGIVTDIYTPKAGIHDKHQHRLLIHLHGGGHFLGNRWIGNVAASSIAATAGIKVISVDYRQWPEARHPAAMEDVVAVYKQLLNDYQAENIGLYGCSSGGYWSAQSVPWIEKSGLPRPGAIGVFGVGFGNKGSDSWMTGMAHNGQPALTEAEIAAMPVMGYFEGASETDPLVLPADFPEALAKYPPTLFVNSTRDFTQSRAVYAHSQMVKQGVETDLHIWDGLNHCFISNPSLPEAWDANAVISKFFDKHLGSAPK